MAMECDPPNATICDGLLQISLRLVFHTRHPFVPIPSLRARVPPFPPLYRFIRYANYPLVTSIKNNPSILVSGLTRSLEHGRWIGQIGERIS